MKSFCSILFLISITTASVGQKIDSALILVKTIKGGLSPKSVVHNHNGLFFSQNMMYRHTITIHDRSYSLLKTIKDKITPSDFGFKGDTVLKGGPVECAFSNNGKYAWVSNYTMVGPGYNKPGCDGCSGKDYDGSYIYKINTTNFKIESIVETGAVPKFLAISSDNKYLLVSNWSSKSVSIIDINSGKLVKELRVGSYPRGIVITKDSKTAYVAAMGSSKIVKIDLINLLVSDFLEIERGPRHLCISPNDKTLYVTLNGSKSVAKIDVKTKSVERIKTGSMPRSMEISNSGDALYIVNYGENSMCKVNTNNFAVTDRIKTNSKPIGITIDNSKNLIWVACYSGSIQVFKDTLFNTSPLSSFIAHVSTTPFVENNIDITSNVNSPETEPKPVKEIEKPVIELPIKEPKGNKLKEHRYYLISGSFKVKSNATKQQARFKKMNFNSEIIAKNNGYFMVTIAGCETSEEASTLQHNFIQDQQIESWIYNKN